jgi:hypothetical protein
MALSDIILNRNEAIVSLSASALDIIGVDTGLNFGTIENVNQLSNSFIVGASVLVDVSNGIPFTLTSGQIYYLINEKDCRLSETIPP